MEFLAGSFLDVVFSSVVHLDVELCWYRELLEVVILVASDMMITFAFVCAFSRISRVNCGLACAIVSALRTAVSENAGADMISTLDSGRKGEV